MATLHNKVNKEELKKRMEENPEKRVTMSFYKYAQIADAVAYRDEIYASFNELGVCGRIYVSGEGINAQISLPEQNIEAFRNCLECYDFLQNLRLNFAIEDDGKSFYKLTIKVKDKIVADGLAAGEIDLENRGEELNAEAFNALTDTEETVVVDMRNHYESEVGHFHNAILPDVETFRESLPIVADMLEDKKDQHIVMYCTGGIRCEKASAYMKAKGFPYVYMLEGGIIEYARQVAKEGLVNKFHGKNFVFDERLGERISTEVIAKCHQCGEPCDAHVNCANPACHILFIQCDSCAEKYLKTCSKKCTDFIQLPEKEQEQLRKTEIFNGTKFGKGRYRANRSSLNLLD